MHFTRFGITLERLEPKHLELVRQWRNSSWVRPYMQYRAFITAEQQVQWFNSLDTRRDWYFTALLQEKPFALFHIKRVDWKINCGEAGGFVGDPRFIGRPEPAQAALALMDFAFLILQLQCLRARYRASLKRIVSFNKQLGYRVELEDAQGFLYATVTSEQYFVSASRLREAAVTLHGNTSELTSPDDWLRRHLDDHCPALTPDFPLSVD